MSAKPQLQAVPDAPVRYYVFQWKDQIDRDAPVWKKLFFYLIYRPFNQFCRFRLGLPTINAEECVGGRRRLLWTEHQGIVEDEWQAEQAAMTPNWGYHKLPYNALLPAATQTRTLGHNYPLADAKTQCKYKRNDRVKIEVDPAELITLQAAIRGTDGLVARHQAKAT